MTALSPRSGRRRRAPLSLAAAALAAGLLALAACAPHVESCGVCDREIHPGVRATLTLDSGKTIPVCCPRCALHYRPPSGRSVRDIRVTDYASGGSLDFKDAYLVEGSDETPCMSHAPPVGESRTPMHLCYDRCMPSLIAFADEPAARAFMAQHGGTLNPPGSLQRPESPPTAASQ